MQTNETTGVDTSTVIGTLTLPSAAVGKDSITYSGQMTGVFVNHRPGDTPPALHIKYNAFMINVVTPDKSVKESFKAIITSVREYMVDQGDDTFKITFKYRRADADRNVDVVEIPPVVSHIFAQGNYAALCVEGEPSVVKRYIEDRLKVFYHGSKLYITYKTLDLTRRLDPNNITVMDEERVPVGTLVIGCVQKLPDKSELSIFTSRALTFLGFPAEGVVIY